MKRVLGFSAAAGAAIVAAIFALVATAEAQTQLLQFNPAKVPQGKVLHYRKSNLDGSHLTNVSVYVIDEERLESLKWDLGATQATLVSARMDWKRFSVREFQSTHLERGKPPEQRATLTANADGTQLKVSFLNGRTVKVHHWPWHSYDFDFASLGLALAHLRDPRADLIFWRTDVVFIGEGTDFAEVGGIRLHFESMELRDRQQVRRYSIGGAGLEHRYGTLWTDATSGLMIEYQIPIGDEPGYKDVHLRLDRMQEMTRDQWEAFKKAKIGER
jgi:hypothetical protein